ncbi:hypothetical protein LCGC14_2368780, partial [marine sediment metagenome]
DNIIKGKALIKCDRERGLAVECWELLHKGRLTELAKNHFIEDEAEVYFNTISGNVFLCDDNYGTLMENGGELDLFINLDENEGFLCDLIDNLKDGDLNSDETEQLYNYLTDDQKEELKKYFVEVKL